MWSGGSSALRSELLLQTLKSEETVLVTYTSRLHDQLNKLKVEELALMSQIRASEKEEEACVELPSPEHDDQSEADEEDINQIPLFDLGNLAMITGQAAEEEEEEEDDEEDEPGDQLTAFLKRLEKTQKTS